VRTAGTAAAVLALLVSASGCNATSSQTAPVRFDSSWPSQTPEHGEATETWTRSGRIIRDYDRVLEVFATFLSPEWRASYVGRRAKRELLGAEAVRALTEEQQTIAEAYYEVALAVATYRHEDNDLQKGERSMWRVVLVDDQGNELRPEEIRRDRRQLAVLRAYFPHVRAFHTVYVARFPRTIELMRPGATRFTLIVSSAVGGVELVWNAR
jgi:sugar phosphate isomerase/epimerase